MEIEKIGRGGFASVYKCKNYIDEQEYAVKKITLKVKDMKDNIEKEIDRILQEAKFLARVHHKNILRYYNSWFEASRYENKTQSLNRQNTLKFQKKSKNLIDNINIDNIKQFSYNENANMKEISHDKRDESPIFSFSKGDDFLSKNIENEEQENILSTYDSLDKSLIKNSKKLSKKLTRKDKKRSIIIKDSNKDEEKRCIDNNLTKNTDIVKKINATDKRSNKDVSNDSNNHTSSIKTLKSITLYILTELCSQTLEGYLNERNQKLSGLKYKNNDEYIMMKINYMQQSIDIAKQIINGISYIHNDCGLVHRDLKPSNIFLTKDGNVKIGDFGLIKKLKYFIPIGSSPMPMLDISKSMSELNSSYKLDNNETPDKIKINDEESIESGQEYTKSSDNHNKPNKHIGSKFELDIDQDDLITKDAGTKTFASPEQLTGNYETFDQKADIWSLGLILLLLFHPMSTYMEQLQIMNAAKQGKLPQELEKDYPMITQLIKKMLSINPLLRPSLEEILKNLSPLDSKTKYCGKVIFKKENSLKWNTKWIKIENQSLYIYTCEADQKAENIYALNQWKIIAQNEIIAQNKNYNRSLSNSSIDIERLLEKTSSSSSSEETNLQELSTSLRPCIYIKNDLQLGFFLKASEPSQTINLYRSLVNLQNKIIIRVSSMRQSAHGLFLKII